MFKGKILKLKTGLIVVPFLFQGKGYDCVVVKGNNNYQVGDYDIFVFYEDLEEAEQIIYEKSKNINVYLDDIRKAPQNFILITNIKDCIELLKRDLIDVLSLDYDLGEFEPTGYDLCKWIVEHNKYPNTIIFHTQNHVGRDNMRELLIRYSPKWVEIEQ